MTTFRSRVRALLVGAGVIALVVVGAGGTLAASTTPPVWACYNTTGQVAMSANAQCRLAGGGQLVQINTQGIQGPTGPTGATGSTGATGPTGAGATFYSGWSAANYSAGLSGTVTLDAICPAVDLGRGVPIAARTIVTANNNQDLMKVALVSSGLDADGLPAEWPVTWSVSGPTLDSVRFSVRVTCEMTVAP